MAAATADGVLRSCPHSDHPHQHGTRAAYQADRCRCPACRKANRQAEAQRTRAIVMGRWEPYVDARQVREHLQLLRKTGLGIDRIVALSQVPRSTVRRLLTSVPAEGSPAQRVRPDIAGRLLRIEPADAVAAPRSLTDATPTRRRLAQLTALGHSTRDLARQLGRTTASIARTLDRPAVTVRTARAVARLHHQLTQEAAHAERLAARDTEARTTASPGPPVAAGPTSRSVAASTGT